jgi:hypothetical protein
VFYSPFGTLVVWKKMFTSHNLKDEGAELTEAEMPSKEPIPIEGKCHAAAKSGKPCGAPAIRGTQYCSLHSTPNRAAELGRRGGQKNKIQLLEPFSETIPAPQNAAELTQTLGKAFVAVFEGRMSPNVGTALSYMGMVLLKAFDVSTIESRLASLETLHKEASELHAAPRPVVYLTVPSPEEFDRAVEEEITKPATGGL